MSEITLKDYDIKNTVSDTINDSFVDIDLSFKRNPLTNDLAVRKGARAISQSLKTIVLTNPNDLPNEPEFGVGVNSLLGENNDPISILELKDKIYEQISRYEPRVELIDVSTTFESHTVRINIAYVIKNDPVEQTLSIEVGRVL